MRGNSFQFRFLEGWRGGTSPGRRVLVIVSNATKKSGKIKAKTDLTKGMGLGLRRTWVRVPVPVIIISRILEKSLNLSLSFCI